MVNPHEVTLLHHALALDSLTYGYRPNIKYILTLLARRYILVYMEAMTPAQFKSSRKKLGLTQVELAKALGVIQITVSRWETGALPIDRRTQMAIEHLLCKPKRNKLIQS